MPTEDAAASCQVQNSAVVSSLSFSFTVPAGANQIFVACVECPDNIDISSVTFNNLPLTVLTNFYPNISLARRVVIAYLLAPPQGTFTCQVQASGNGRFTVQARSYSNVHQTNTWGSVQTASSAGNTTGVSVTLSSVASDVCLDGVVMGGSTSGCVPNTGTTGECSTGVAGSQGGSGNRSAVNAVMGWHHITSGSRSWAYAAAPLHDYIAPIAVNPTVLTLAEQQTAPAVTGGAAVNPTALMLSGVLPAAAVAVSAFTFDSCQEAWGQQGPPPGSNDFEPALALPAPSGWATAANTPAPSGWRRTAGGTAPWDLL